MKTLLKVLGGLVAVIVVLIIAAVVLVPLFFDPNDHKDRIATLVKENTGRDLTIEGDIGLTVFPWLGLELGAVALSNAPGFPGATFASARKTSVRLKLVPLLGKRVEMGTVTLHGLQLNLARNADGTTNWDDLAKPSSGEPAEPKGEGGFGLAGLAVGGLDVRDARIEWDDRQAGQKYRITNLGARTGRLAAGEPVELAVELDVEGGKPALQGRIELSGEIVADVSAAAYRVSGLTLTVDLTGEQFPAGKLAAKLATDVQANLTQQTASLSDLTLESGQLAARGNVAATGITSAPEFTGELSLAKIDVKGLLRALSLPPVETADAQALTALEVTFGIAGNANRVSLAPITIVLDDTKLTGEVAIADLQRMALRYDLTVDEIDVDRYLPPATAELSASAPATPGTATGGLPMEALRGLDVEGTAKVGKLKIAKLSVSDVVVTTKAKDGVLRIHPLAAKLYEGEYSGDVALDARTDAPILTVAESLRGVQAGPLLTDLQGVDRLSGKAEVSAKLRATGADAEAMKRTLNGTVRFDFTDGAVKGLNINQMIRDAKAKLTGGGASGSAPNQTDFSELGGTINLTNGLATNTDLAMKSPFLRVAGAGKANLVDESVDYRLAASVVASAAGQGGSELQELVGIDIPIRVTGTFAEPSYGLDFEALAAGIAKSKVGALVSGGAGATVGKATEAAKSTGAGALKGLTGGDSGSAGGSESVEKKVGGALKGLFKN